MANKKKYVLLQDQTIEIEGKTLYRIKAIRSFSNVVEGAVGGYIEKESNLSHCGKCWIYEDAKVYDNAKVRSPAFWFREECNDNALLQNDATVRGTAYIYGNAIIGGCVEILGNATVCGNAQVIGQSRISGTAFIQGGIIKDLAQVCGFAQVYGGIIGGQALVKGETIVKEGGIIGQMSNVEFGICEEDLSKNFEKSIICQTGLIPQEDYVIA